MYDVAFYLKSGRTFVFRCTAFEQVGTGRFTYEFENPHDEDGPIEVLSYSAEHIEMLSIRPTDTASIEGYVPKSSDSSDDSYEDEEAASNEDEDEEEEEDEEDEEEDEEDEEDEDEEDEDEDFDEEEEDE